MDKAHVFAGTLCAELKGLRKMFASFLFRKVEFDEDSIKAVAEFSEKGHIVYASFHNSNIALFLLYALLDRQKLARPVFALDHNPVLLQRGGFLWQRVVRWFRRVFLRKKTPYVLDTDYIENVLKEGNPILFPVLTQKFYLRRYTERRYDSLLYLIEMQRTMHQPIFLMPEMIFWNRNPERTGGLFNLAPGATGNRGVMGGLLSAATPTLVRVLRPINLQEELESVAEMSAEQAAMHIRQKLLDAYQREKRLILGPVLRSRAELMEKVLYSPNVLKAIEHTAEEEKIPQWKARVKAFKYFNEIASDFSIAYVHVFEVILDYVFKKIFTGMECDPEFFTTIREASEKGPLVFTPCHKSHMDYLILSYLFYKNRIMPPHIAAGVNLSFFPLGTIFRHCGAFFLRRTFRGLSLYPDVFKQYVKTMVSEGYSIEFFIEGGRTRTGRLVYPRQGLLSYLIDAVDEGYNQDLVFVPVSITYDRVLEEKSYEREVKGASKRKETVGSVVRSRRLLKRQYGMVYVSAAKPFTLKELENEGFQDEHRATVAASRVIMGINKVTPVSPVSLVTMAMMVMPGNGFSRNQLLDALRELHTCFLRAGSGLSEKINDPSNLETVMDRVLNFYLTDRIIEPVQFDELEKLDDMFALKDETRPRIAFYKNSIEHFSLPASFAAIALLTSEHRQVSDSDLHETLYHFLTSLLANEFIFPEEILNVETGLHRTMDGFFHDSGYITVDESGKRVLVPEKKEVILYFARILQDLLESYLVAVKTVHKFQGKRFAQKDLLIEIRKAGVRMFHTGEIRRSESLSLPNYSTAVKIMIKKGLIREEKGDPRNPRLRITSGAELDELFETLGEIVKVVQ